MANVNWDRIRKMAHEEFGNDVPAVIIDGTVDSVRRKGWKKYTVGCFPFYLKADSAWDMVQALLGRKEAPHEMIYDPDVGC